MTMFDGGYLLKATLDKNLVTAEYSDGYNISFPRYDPLTKGDAWEELTSRPNMVKVNDTCYESRPQQERADRTGNQY